MSPTDGLRRISFWLLLAFVFTIPLEDTVTFGLGRISRVVGLVAFAVWALTVAARGRVKPRVPAMSAAALLVAWATASYFWSPDRGATLSKVSTLIQMVGVLWLIWDQVEDRTRAVAVMRIFVLASAVAALVTVFDAQQAAGVGRRFSVTDVGENNTGCLLAVSVGVAWHLFTLQRGRRWAWLSAAVIPLLAWGALLSASRTALLALGLGLILVVVDPRNLMGRRLVLIVLGAGIAVVLVAQLPQGVLTRLGTTGSELTSGTLNARTTYWRIAFDVFSDHPVGGVGAGAFKEQSAEISVADAADGTAAGDFEGKLAHNMFISVTAELGVVGIALLLTMLALALFELRKAPPEARRTWVVVCTMWFVGANSLTWEVRKITWVVVGLTLVQQALSAAPPPTPPRQCRRGPRLAMDVVDARSAAP